MIFFVKPQFGCKWNISLHSNFKYILTNNKFQTNLLNVLIYPGDDDFGVHSRRYYVDEHGVEDAS